MTAPIRLTVNLQPDETATGFLSRVACINGRTLYQFGADLELPIPALIAGQKIAVLEFAALSGADPGRLHANAFVTPSGRSSTVRGMAFRSSGLVRTGLRFCPHCISDQIARPRENPWAPAHIHAYQRIAWSLANIRCCPDHAVELAACTDQRLGTPQAYDFSMRIEPFVPELPRLCADAQPMLPSACDRFIHARLNGEAPPPGLLGKLDIHAVAQSAERLGLLILHGPRTRISAMNSQMLQTCAAAGFKVLEGGTSAVRAILENLERRGKDTDAYAAIKGTYGYFYSWLAREAPEKELHPLREILRDHLLERFPFAAGDVVLGRTVQKRTLHSIRSLHIEKGIHPKKARKLLHALGLINETNDRRHDERVVFDADEAERALVSAADDLSEVQLQAYIGADRVQTRLLIEGGYIKPWLTAAGDGERRKHGFYERFTKAEADRFLMELAADAIVVSEAPPGSATIPVATRKANWKSLSVVDLVLGGKLSWVGKLAGRNNFGAMLVNVVEIKDAARGPKLKGLMRHQLADALGISSGAITKLIGAQILTTMQERHPIQHCLIETVPEIVVEQFRREFSTLGELCRTYAKPPLAVLKSLAEIGCRPAFTKSEVGVYLFRRSTLPA